MHTGYICKHVNSIAPPRCARAFRFSLQTAVDCERAFLAALDGNCKTPIAGQVTERLARVFLVLPWRLCGCRMKPVHRASQGLSLPAMISLLPWRRGAVEAVAEREA